MLLGESPDDYDKHFILNADIDLDPNLPGRRIFDRAVIAPDVNDSEDYFQGTPFTGVFDGNDHTISNLTITGGTYLGLFGVLGIGAEVKDLGVVAVNITSGASVGGLAGRNSGAVFNCYSTGSVTGSGNVGGLVGSNSREGSITMSYSTATATGDRFVGGLAGGNWGSIASSYSTGSVSGNDDLGGLEGGGGLVGVNVGGLIKSSYSAGSVSGDSRVGGLVGYNRGGRITSSYSTGSVNGDSSVGGLVGVSHVGTIEWSYSTGSVSGNHDVGGLLGVGNVDGGGLGATVPIFWDLTNFWDIQTSGQTTSAGGIGKTTAAMQDIQTYLDGGWDFVDEIGNGTHQIWQMPEGGGYPILSVFSGYTPLQLNGLGTAEDPYLISNALELGAMIYYSPYAHYRLDSSIDLLGICWGTAVIPAFEGTFDGNNLTISHLTIKGVDNLGLFERLALGAEIKDLELVDVNITGLGVGVGGLAVDNYGTITHCYSTGTGAVSGRAAVGGLVGYNADTVTHCYSTGSVLESDWSDWRDFGGLMGSNYGTVTQCYSTGAVSGTMSVVGGLVGTNYGNITNSYSTGSVNGTKEVGGLVGLNIGDGSIIASYSTGMVTGNEDVGGLVGSNSGNITSSFWDMYDSGQATSVGGTGLTTVEMQTTSTFLNAGWDFVDETVNGTEDIWWILEGQDYPRLWWELIPEN
jgi:hypothetical protein